MTKTLRTLSAGQMLWKESIEENRMADLPDIQGTKPMIQLPIQQVGVENVEVPFMLESKDGGFRDMVAKVSMFGSLDAETKGVSMSRFIRTLIPYLRKPLKHFLIKQILNDLKENLEVHDVYMKFEFKLPIQRRSIVTDDSFPIFHDCKFEGQLVNGGEFRFYQGVKVQYASYCPCSAELCNHLGDGFPHAQRAYTEVLLEVIEDPILWLEDIIKVIEDSVINIPYPIIKRPDEQMIAKRASENPMFVEDAIRAICSNLNNLDNIIDYYVSCRHEESIHTSEASAMAWKGIEGGFDSKMGF